MTPPGTISPLPRPTGTATETAAETATRRIFVRDLVLPCLIGIHRHEQDGRQRVRINLDLDILEEPAPATDRLADVVCYEALIDRVRALVGGGHVNLVETLAERLAAACLDDGRVRAVTVKLEKLDVFADAASVGVEIHRRNPRQTSETASQAPVKP